jgi:hypothetical protein
MPGLGGGYLSSHGRTPTHEKTERPVQTWFEVVLAVMKRRTRHGRRVAKRDETEQEKRGLVTFEDYS